MPYMSVNGAELYYETHGAGPAMLLIPGFDSGAWSFYRQWPTLSERFRVVLFDPRGSGRSPEAPIGFGIDHMAHDAATLLARLGIRKAAIVGVSMGGFVALEFALQHARRVSCLVLLGSSAGGPKAEQASSADLAMMIDGAKNAPQDGRRGDESLYFSDHFLTAHADEVDIYSAHREANRRPSTDWLVRVDKALTFDARSRLGRVRAPTLILSGDADRIVPISNARDLAAGIPDARLHWIEGGRHLCHVEFAHTFNQTVADFASAYASDGG